MKVVKEDLAAQGKEIEEIKKQGHRNSIFSNKVAVFGACICVLALLSVFSPRPYSVVTQVNIIMLENCTHV